MGTKRDNVTGTALVPVIISAANLMLDKANKAYADGDTALTHEMMAQYTGYCSACAAFGVYVECDGEFGDFRLCDVWTKEDGEFAELWKRED